jgi:hypothetical protein
MTAMTQKERSAKTAAKRAAAGERELRIRSRPGPIAKLSDLMVWHGIEEISEAMQLLILNAHALGPEGSAHLLAVPRHEIELPENVARALRKAGAAEAARLDRCEA